MPLTVAKTDESDRSADRDPRKVQASTLVVNGLDPSALSADYLELLRAGGVNCWVHAAGSAEQFASTLTFCDQHSDRIVFARSVREIREAYGMGKIAHVSPWQDANLLIAEGGGYLAALVNLRAYHELGLRICGIAYNLANAFGGGCLESELGLTRMGHQLIEQLHRLRIIVDVGGHTGEQASLDAIDIAPGVPVVCTHTNVRALNDNPRCTSDRVLEAIARSGGVIGISAFNDFHARTRFDSEVQRTPQVELDRHLDQYDYLKRLVGVDHIGLGPDFIEGRAAGAPVSDMERPLLPPEAYSPERPWLYVKGFERISDLPNVTAGLIARGWSTGEIRKVLGENWLRVYEAVWGE